MLLVVFLLVVDYVCVEYDEDFKLRLLSFILFMNGIIMFFMVIIGVRLLFMK